MSVEGKANHWIELEEEVKRLKEINAELLAACKGLIPTAWKVYSTTSRPGDKTFISMVLDAQAVENAKAAIAKAEEKPRGGSSANYVPPGATALPNDEGNC